MNWLIYFLILLQAAGSDEWTEWGQMEEFSVRVEPSSSLTQEQLPANDDLFHDMTPVFQKPKKVRDKNIDLLLSHIGPRLWQYGLRSPVGGGYSLMWAI